MHVVLHLCQDALPRLGETGKFSESRDRDSQEAVTLPIFSWACLEKPHEDVRLLSVFKIQQSFSDVFHPQLWFHPPGAGPHEKNMGHSLERGPEQNH